MVILEWDMIIPIKIYPCHSLEVRDLYMEGTEWKGMVHFKQNEKKGKSKRNFMFDLKNKLF